MVRWQYFCAAAFLTIPLSACGGGGGPSLPTRDGGGINVNPNADSGVRVGPDGGPVDTGQPPGADGGPVDADGGVGADSGPMPPLGTPPTLAAVSVHQAGRNGVDVFVQVEGADLDSDLAAFVITFFDASNSALLVMDTTLDGHADASALVVSPQDIVLDDTNFSANVTFKGLYGEHPEIASAEIFALDHLGGDSNVLDATIDVQALRAEGAECSPDYLSSRCEEGLGCRGSPAVCAAGERPELADFVYYSTPDGLRILVSGRDADDDIRFVILEFLDSSGLPIMLDLDNDGVDDSSEFEIDARGTTHNGDFFIELEPAANFSQLVQNLAATPMDSQRRSGNRLMATLRSPPSVRTGSACDPRGFDVCRPGSVCYPGIIGEANACSPIEGRRTRICTDAPVLNASLGMTRIVGVAQGVSMWDAPDECAALDPKDRPEGAVMLDLPSSARTVTLTTDLPGNGFNTVLYVIDGCAFNGDRVLGCHDNVPDGVGSQLILHDVPAGRYLVVVDSWNPFGGAFELQVVVEE